MFRTKPASALGVVRQAVARGVPGRWVTAAGAYGDRPTCAPAVRGLGKWDPGAVPEVGAELVRRPGARRWGEAALPRWSA